MSTSDTAEGRAHSDAGLDLAGPWELNMVAKPQICSILSRKGRTSAETGEVVTS